MLGTADCPLPVHSPELWGAVAGVRVKNPKLLRIPDSFIHSCTLHYYFTALLIGRSENVRLKCLLAPSQHETVVTAGGPLQRSDNTFSRSEEGSLPARKCGGGAAEEGAPGAATPGPRSRAPTESGGHGGLKTGHRQVTERVAVSSAISEGLVARLYLWSLTTRSRGSRSPVPQDDDKTFRRAPSWRKKFRPKDVRGSAAGSAETLPSNFRVPSSLSSPSMQPKKVQPDGTWASPARPPRAVGAAGAAGRDPERPA